MNYGDPIKIGGTAKIYLHDGKIIKIFNDYLPKTEAEYEASKQRYAHSCGLPVPCVYEVTELGGKQAIIMEYMEGKSIGDIIQENAAIENTAKIVEYMKLSVDVQMKIHDVKADDFEVMTDRLSGKILSARLISDAQKKMLLEKLRGMKYEKQLCHGDCHWYNMILKDDDVAIIDWVDATAGDVKADICRTYVLYSQFSTELAELYLRLYCEKSRFSQGEIIQWLPIIAGARLSENVSSEKAYQLVDLINYHCPGK
jgi:tRNA A-37 threonylcarbamoyl transferase component Bud32